MGNCSVFSLKPNQMALKRNQITLFCNALREYPNDTQAPQGLTRVVRKNRREGQSALTLEQAETWIMNGAPPVIVAAAYFESHRDVPENVEEFLVAVQIIGERMANAEKEKLCSQFIFSCKGIIATFKQQDYDRARIDRFCSRDIFDSLGEMWDVARVHYQPVPFKNEKATHEVLLDVNRRLAVHGASRHVRTEPPIDSFLATTRTKEFHRFFEDSMQTPAERFDLERVESCCRRVMLEARFMAHALRTYNKLQNGDTSKMITINRILLDIADFEMGESDSSRSLQEDKLMMLRCAAQNHLTLMLSINSYLSELAGNFREWSRVPGSSLSRIQHFRGMNSKIKGMQEHLVMIFKQQLPEDIVSNCGYNILQAEEGHFGPVKKRYDAQS